MTLIWAAFKDMLAHSVRMNHLWKSMRFCHTHIPVNNQYPTSLRAAIRYNLIRAIHTPHQRKVADMCKSLCVWVFSYRDGQYFHRGVLDLVPWVLLVTAAKQEPASQIKHMF